MGRIPLAARGRPPAERFLRARRRMLQTPVVRFAHPGTGRTVTVVGTVHIAPAGYYRRLNAILARLEAAGALVFYEWIGSAAETDWSAASDTERDARDAAIAYSQDNTKAACRYLGWTRQQDALAYAASWRNLDITDLELIQRLGGQAVLDQREGFEAMFEGRSHDQRDVLTGVGAAVMLRLVAFDRYQLLWRLAGAAAPGVSRTVIDDRNKTVLDSLPSDRDCVLIWGLTHLPGLAAGLRQAGYRRQVGAWLNAGQLPPLWTDAKEVLGVLRDDRRAAATAPRQGSGPAGSSGM